MKILEFYFVSNKLNEELTPVDSFLNKAERVKSGDKIIWKGQLVGYATGQVENNRVLFGALNNKIGFVGGSNSISSLPIDLVRIIGKNTVAETTKNSSNLYSALKDFLPLAMKELRLTHVPKIRLKHSLNYNGQSSFGSFSNGGIELGVHSRHPVDVCRTLAHELVHYQQGKNNQLDHESGETGSHEENQANSVAGIIMRKFSKQYPQYITQ